MAPSLDIATATQSQPKASASPASSATSNDAVNKNAGATGVKAPDNGHALTADNPDRKFEEMLAELLGDAPNTTVSTSTSLLPTDKDKQDSTKTNDASVLDASALLLDPQTLLLLADSIPRAPESASTNVAQSSAVSADRKTAATTFNTSTIASSLLGTDRSATKLDGKPIATTAQQDGSKDSGGNADKSAPNALSAVATAAHDRVADLHDQPMIRAHVGTATWTEELAGKLTVMVGRGLQSASLQLSPEHLGPLEIHISVQNNQTSVWFGAVHADTRIALEQALPRLREMLAGQGLNLSDAGVFREAPRDRAPQHSSARTSGSGSSEREISIAAIGLRGIVDAYA